MIEMVVTDSAFVLCLRWMLAVVFVVGATHKLASPSMFVTTLQAYRLLPPGIAVFAAYVVIATEVGAALALLFNSAWGSAVSLGLLTIYTLAIIVNLLRGRRDIDCGCAGPYLRQTLSPWLVVRNAGFIAVSLLTLVDAETARPLGFLDWFTALAAAGSFALIYFAANQITSVNARYSG